MTRLPKRLALTALLTAAAALPCLAESSLASSASDSLSQSSKSISDSLTDSSHSSSPDNRQVKGDYKVIDMADATDRPGMVQLRLRHVELAGTNEDEILLTLPREAAAHGNVGKDSVITALQRPYGIEFAAGQPHAAFFLALADDWAGEMKTAPLTL